VYRFSIIKVSDKKWSDIISLSYQYDFYHTQSYSLLERKNEPVLLVASHDNDFIAIPLIIRKIEGTDFFDCTSVYGYCGPVSNVPIENISSNHILFFQAELLQFFKYRKIISAFSRLHPIFNQSRFFENFGIIKEINKTVAIDLSLPDEDQKKKYRKSTLSEINQLKIKGYIVAEAQTKAEIDMFAQLYQDYMRKINADSYLFFSKTYFYQFLNNPSFKTKLLLAKKENIMTAGAIFTLSNKIMQYHLAASSSEYKKDAPMKIIVDQARLIGNNYKMDILHLGGGVGGRSDDSLFYFKSGFSDTRLIYNTWQLIVDESIYAYLADLFKIDQNKTIDYFPIYRAK
jgi:hypothetical protein